MIEKSCFCGKGKKNFLTDIVKNYVGECCEEAGYDHLGNPPKVEAPVEKKVKKEGPTRRYTPSGKYSKKNKVESEDNE